MGSWFSSDSSNEKPIKTHTPQTYSVPTSSFHQYATSKNNVSVPSYTLREHNDNFYYGKPSLNHSTVSSLQCTVRESRPNYSLVKTVESTLHKFVLQLTDKWDLVNANSEFELCLLTSNSLEYQEILWLFKKTTQKQFTVHKIYRVQNPYLLGCYLLKKEEMRSRYGHVSEEYLFHGTKEENKYNICRNNFDWRKHGNSVGNIFGKGVSFTPISCYASHYSDKHCSERMMFVSKVLIAEETIGNKDMKIPPVFDYPGLRYDTATKENRQVIVKFSDCEFYPSYVVYYTGQYVKKEQKPMRF